MVTMVLLEGITATTGYEMLEAKRKRVVTTPRGETRRMHLLPESATATLLLDGTTAIPAGPQNPALEPMPSAKEPLPLPASVETTPRGVTSRMRLFPVSATTKTPLEGSTAMPRGLQKLALAPGPSAKVALPLPAKVVTASVEGEKSRIR
jgi:hypothetical protein